MPGSAHRRVLAVPVVLAMLLLGAGGCGGGRGTTNQVSLAQFHRVQASLERSSQAEGMTEAEVRRILGSPERTGSLTSREPIGNQSNCWFYSQAGPLASVASRSDKAVICFDAAGRVTATKSGFAAPTPSAAALTKCIGGSHAKLVPAGLPRHSIAGEKQIVVERPNRIRIYVYVFRSVADAERALTMLASTTPPDQIGGGNVVIVWWEAMTAGEVSEIPQEEFTKPAPPRSGDPLGARVEDCVYSAA